VTLVTCVVSSYFVVIGCSPSLHCCCCTLLLLLLLASLVIGDCQRVVLLFAVAVVCIPRYTMEGKIRGALSDKEKRMWLVGWLVLTVVL
jgi:hypothetical protein